jgi:hypothetical protein
VLVGTIPAEKKETCILVTSPLKPTYPRLLKYIPSTPAKSYIKTLILTHLKTDRFIVFKLSTVLHVYWLVFRQQSWAYKIYV